MSHETLRETLPIHRVKPTLTRELIEALPAKEKPYQVRDGELPGFAVTVYTNGTKTYMVSYKLSGRVQKVLSLGRVEDRSVEDAREAARQMKDAAQRDRDAARHHRPSAPHRLRVVARRRPVSMTTNRLDDIWTAVETLDAYEAFLLQALADELRHLFDDHRYLIAVPRPDVLTVMTRQGLWILDCAQRHVRGAFYTADRRRVTSFALTELRLTDIHGIAMAVFTTITRFEECGPAPNPVEDLPEAQYFTS